MKDNIQDGRYSYNGLERVMHEKARLGILTSLLTYPDGLLFNELRELCQLTDGNLSRHLQILQQEGFVEIWKRFQKKRPQTLCRLTPKGRERFLEYVNELQRVVNDASKCSVKNLQSFKKKEDELEGWSPV